MTKISKKDSVNHFFVDEAGDLALFSRSGRIIVGEQGNSKFFMVAVAHIPNPASANQLLSELREELLSDPYFSGVPSMQPASGKTARQFHAAKDVPEVRRDVFARLPILKTKVRIAIRRKHVLAAKGKSMFRHSNRKWNSAEIYADLVKRLFKDVLHKADRNRIIFAKHAKWGRREAMAQAIERAKTNFESKHGIASDKPTEIISAYPWEYGGLQVVDYYLWALQRMFERGEDRYFNIDKLRPAYRLIMDLDDTRNKDYGEWYSDDNPLTLKKIMPPAG